MQPSRIFLAALVLALVLVLPPAGPFPRPASGGGPLPEPGASTAALPGPDPAGGILARPTASGGSCNGLSSPLIGSYSTNASGPCRLGQNLTVAGTGNLAVWANNNLTVGNTSSPLTLNDSGALGVGDGGSLSILPGAHVTLEVWGSLTVTSGSRVVLSPDTVLLLEPGSHLDVSGGGSLLMNGSGLVTSGGSVTVSQGTWSRGGVPPPTPAVSHINLTGSLSALQTIGVPVEWVNATSYVAEVSVAGYFTHPATVAHDAFAGVGNLSLDDAVVSAFMVTSARNVALGRPVLIPDMVQVVNMTVATPVPGNLTIYHAVLDYFHSSGASRVTVSNSTLGGNASTVLDASLEFRSNASTSFQFPLVLDTGAAVVLTNISAPSLTVNGPANVTAFNWPGPSEPVNGTMEVPSIRVANAKATVEVYRFVSVRVLGVTSSLPPPGTHVVVQDLVLPTAPTLSVPISASGSVGLFLPTDSVTSVGDLFLGEYRFSAVAPGFQESVSANLSSNGMVVTISLAGAPLVISYSPYVFVGIVLLAVVTTVTVSLWYQTRRLRRGRPPSPEPEDEEPPGEEGPPAEDLPRDAR